MDKGCPCEYCKAPEGAQDLCATCSAEYSMAARQEHIDTGPHDGCSCKYCKSRRSSLTAADPQPPPTAGRGPAVLILVQWDLALRAEAGMSKYGMLHANNYREALDLCMYLRQALYERAGE